MENEKVNQNDSTVKTNNQNEDAKQNNSKVDNDTSRKKGAKSNNKVAVIKIIVVIAVCLFGYLVFSFSRFSQGKLKYEISSILKRQEIINELNVLTIPYNGIYTKKDADNEKDLYYIAFKSYVKIGLDIDKIEINDDAENKILEVVLPEPQINDINIGDEDDSMDYIFIDKSEDKELSESKRKEECRQYIKEKFDNEDAYKNMARENAKGLISGFLNPIVKNSEYTLVIR